MLTATDKSHFRFGSYLSVSRTKLAPLAPQSVFSLKDCRQLKYAFVFFGLLVAIQCVGCKQTSSDSIPTGAYAYTSYDSGGAILVSGWLTIIISDSTVISGEWHFKEIGSPQRIGPQTGDGKLAGGINGDQAWIELNPHVRNNNLQLNGRLEQALFSGQWTWISYSGISNQGTFKAVRK